MCASSTKSARICTRRFCCACWGASGEIAGTVQGGLEVLRGFLTQAGVASDQYVFYDGSGLSRQNLVTPQRIVQLLRYASTQPWGAAYKASFPVAGVDGSLAERLTAPGCKIGSWPRRDR